MRKFSVIFLVIVLLNIPVYADDDYGQERSIGDADEGEKKNKMAYMKAFDTRKNKCIKV